MKKKNKKVNAGILIIGNEILSGRTQDKNTTFISNWLNSECGISVNEVRIIPDIEKETPLKEINSVGVIGAGTMGGGISMNFANVGIPVTIIEQSQERLDKGLGIIRKNYENTASKGRITNEQVEERMALINGQTSLDALDSQDLIIEAVFENMDLKKDIFKQLDGICKDGAILASNTSALDVNEIDA